MPSDLEFKEALLSSGIFRSTSNSRYTCQCPFCNDDKRHMYVLIDLTSDIPVLYNCFKCSTKGKMNREFLEFFGLENLRIPKSSGRKQIDLQAGTIQVNMSSFVTPEDDIDGITSYVRDRVGVVPTLEELQQFKFIGNPVQYASEYLNRDNLHTLKNRHWFQMTNGNIIGRWFDDNSKFRWLKYRTKNIVMKRGLYVMKTPIDLYQPINVCISEGIFDSIGLYYHYDHGNNMYISCMGRDYGSGIQHVLGLGIFGTSVNIKIFQDSDVATPTPVDPVLKKLFNKVEYFHNIKGKDYGLPPDQIEIEKIFNYN